MDDIKELLRFEESDGNMKMTDTDANVDVLQNQDEVNNELVARPYQIEMLEVAKEEDTILFLPTGSGKTFIAMMLITQMSDDLERPFTEGGKRSIFLVNTVPLVTQQKEFLMRHLPLRIGGFSGDMNVDFWDKAKWEEELDKYQVLVMTSQILLNMLMHGYVNLSQLNLLIFDECHHAVNDHAMRQIMQMFEHTSRAYWPRVLGLTATLLNGTCKSDKVEDELSTLENTYLSKIATCEDMTLVEKFSTSPEERLVSYFEKPMDPTALEKGLKMLEMLCEAVDSLVLDPILPPSPVSGARLLDRKKTERKKLTNILRDSETHIRSMGLYGGSRACLAHTIQLERLRRRSEDHRTYLVFTMMISGLTAIRKLFQDEMSGYDELSQIMLYSSNKLLVLFELIRQNLPDPPGKEEEELVENYPQVKKGKKFCSIVFVERRYTAKILASLLKSLQHVSPEFSAMKPDFIVGYNSNPFNQTRQAQLERKWNNECLRRFCNGTNNLLVASDVLEEGIDIPQCNLVIKYDAPRHYRSYVQSKGRARQKESKYFIMYAKDDNKFKGAYENYRHIELQLQQILVGMQRKGPSEADVIEELFYQTPYDTGIAMVSLASACSLVNRYCSLLPQDKFTKLQPTWSYKGEENGLRVFLQLPMNSPLKSIIKGETFHNIKMAKRSAALETCKALHCLGLLNDHLLPVMPKDAEDSELFPLWEEENSNSEEQTGADNTSRPGTKKSKRPYPTQYPEHLTGCRPVPQEKLYLHVIQMTPIYPYPEDNRRRVFYSLFKSSETFAILCSKEFPKLCQFPIYMNVGELQVTLQSNDSVIQITDEEEQLLENFNTLIFSQVLKLMKQFIVVDKSNLENAFFLVPIKPDNTGRYIIDWDAVRAHQVLPDVLQPSEEELQQLCVTEDVYQCALVTPWYRALVPEQVYVVTEVCREMSPETIFPSEDYSTYAEYFHRKYNLNIINKQQPLLEVKVISNKINCLRPRATTAKGLTSRRKRQELQEDFEENLVPELCVRYSFPAVYWLKATALPTIIHRIFYLLLAEEFRRNVALDLGIGDIDLVYGRQWLPLQYDKTTTVEETVTSKVDSATKVNLKPSQRKNPWGNEKEPLDIDRHMTEVTLIEVIGFDDFISKPIEGNDNQDVCSFSTPEQLRIHSCPIKDIAVLKQTPKDIGPELRDILRALTTSAANDIVDMERLETLGDSFLKFSVSLFLFLYYPSDNEGKLTYLKGKIVGNRNLYYCGKHRKLGSIIKVHDFAPASDWIPPSMCVPRELQQIIRMAEMSPNVLYELSIPHEEQISGKISPATSRIIQQKLLAWEGEAGCHTSMENFISLQTVSDKSIADCVEAIIGAYLQANGIRTALQIVRWFKILMPEKATVKWMFDTPAPSAHLGSGDVDMHLKCVKQLEETLHYTFHDKHFLLQALSHPSYQENIVTECYQRLEFLGDAILDFLITCHIFETCGDLSPGKLTDLRSALVNNITFASLIVRYGLHKFLLFGSTKLLDAIERFVRRQEENGHVIDEQILLLIEEEDCQMAEAVEVPKALGDLFEALAGAIYLDSGKDLNVVWRVFYPMMKQEIELFSVDIPLNPVRRLYEMCSGTPKFGKGIHLAEVDRTLITVAVVCDGKFRRFHGFGQTKSEAKCAASKMALRYILTNCKKVG